MLWDFRRNTVVCRIAYNQSFFDCTVEGLSVSYTHLDVYKRQPILYPQQLHRVQSHAGENQKTHEHQKPDRICDEAYTYADILDLVAKDFGLNIEKTEKSPMQGLIEYHSIYG